LEKILNIYDFIEKYFELLKTFQGWTLIIFGLIAGLMLYQAIHRSELCELQLKGERLEAMFQQQNITGEELTTLQIEFLEKLIKYQESNNLTKVVIGKDGKIFDHKNKKATEINVINAFLGKNTSIFGKDDLEKLVISIPEKYLKLIPEMRFDSPYVVTFTDATKEIIENR